MKKKYDKDGDYHKEIELKWDAREKEYVLTKRNVSGKNSQGHSISFTKEEFQYAKDLFGHVI